MNKPRAASGFLKNTDAWKISKNTKLKSMFHLKALKAVLLLMHVKELSQSWFLEIKHELFLHVQHLLSSTNF